MFSIFMQLLPEWAPNVHPVLVHFPIAIFFFAAFMDLISFILPVRWWGERKTAITYFIGAIFVVIVFFTGKMAADSIDIPKYAYGAVGAHAGWAHWTVWFFGIYGVIRLVLSFIDRLRGVSLHVVMFLISLVGLFFLYETGEHGGKLVFGYGLGTGQLVEQHVGQPIKPQKVGFQQAENGDISWIAGNEARQTVARHFTFLQGDSTGLQAPGASGRDSSALIVQNPHFFFITDGNTYGDIQIKMTIDPKNYQGDIVLAHNVHDAQNYAYMILHPDGSAQLGRYKNGEKSIVKKGRFKDKDVKMITLAVSGKHIHGSVNGEQILHGHSPQTGPGAVGLKLDGNGMFALKKWSVENIAAGEHSEHPNHEGDEH